MKTFTQLLEDTYTSEYKIKKVMGPDGEWHDKKTRPHRIDFKNSKMHGEPAQKDNKDMNEAKVESKHTFQPGDVVHVHYHDIAGKTSHGTANIDTASSAYATIKHPEHGETIKFHQGINGKGGIQVGTHPYTRAGGHVISKKPVKEETMTIDEQINEVLSKDATAGDWIHDFIHSDNPKFADKSKDKRKEMALAAYYAKQRNEEVELDEAAQGHTIEAHGVKGMKRTTWHKTFKHADHLNDWAEKNDAEVHGTRDLEQAKKGNLSPAIKEAKDEKEYGYEGDMALNQLATLTRCAEMIKDLLKPDTDMPEWVQSKITLATDYIQTAADYMYSEMNEEVKDEYARKVDKHLKNKYAPVAPVPDKKYIKGTPENLALKASRKPINGHPTNVKEETMKSFKEMLQSLDEKSEQAKQNKTMKNMMDASRGARFKVQNKLSGDAVRDWDGKHPTPRAQNVAIGRALRNEAKDESEMNEELKGSQHKLDKNKNGKVDAHDFKILRGEQCPECGKAPCECGNVKEEVETIDEIFADQGSGSTAKDSAAYMKRRNAYVDRNSPESKEKIQAARDKIAKDEAAESGKALLAKINNKINKEEVETRTVSFKDFMNEIKMADLPKRTVKGSSYGAQYHDPEGDDAFDRKPKQVAKPEPEVKRGRGRPAGSKSGANQKVTSGTKRSGVDYSGYKLHLPNSNR